MGQQSSQLPTDNPENEKKDTNNLINHEDHDHKELMHMFTINNEYDQELQKNHEPDTDDVPQMTELKFYSNKSEELCHNLNDHDQITVFLNNDTYDTMSFQFDNREQVCHVKYSVSEKLSVPSNLICIRYKNNVLRDYHCLSHNNIQNSSILHMQIYDEQKPMKLILKSNNKDFEHQFSIEVFCHQTRNDISEMVNDHLIKHKINRKVCLIKAANMVLYPYRGNLGMYDRGNVLNEIGVQNGDIFQVTYTKELLDNSDTLLQKIFVRFTSGRTATFAVDANDTIQDVKARIQEAEGIPPEQCRLLLFKEGETNNIHLEDGQTLSNYHIQNEQTIYFQLRLRGGCFLKNTMILMGNRQSYAIQKIKQGDQIVINENNLVSKVDGIYSFLVDDYVELNLSHNITIKCTLGHPFYIKNKGLCAISP
eukprot:32873_1